MRRLAILRSICALACALAVNAVIVVGAVSYRLLSSETTTLPELDLTSIDLSFSETPDETAAPAAPPPQPAVEPPPAPEPPPPPVVEPPPPPVPEPPPPPVPEPPPPPVPEPPPPPAPEPPPPPTPKPPPPPVVEPPKPVPPQTPKPVVPPQAAPRPTETKSVPKTPPEPNPPPKPQELPPPKPQPSVAVPPAPAPSQARVKLDKQPKLKTKIDTRKIYPEGARERGEEGSVTLMFEVTPGGRCSNMRITDSCGFPELEQAAIRAVTQARFEPARRGNSKVPAPARITLTFRLKD